MKKIQNPIKICLRLRKFLIFRWLDMGEHGRELLLSAPSILQLYCTCIDLSCWRRMQDWMQPWCHHHFSGIRFHILRSCAILICNHTK